MKRNQSVDVSRALQIEGWMSELELTWLAQRAQECYGIIEIGSHHGRSTRALGDHVKVHVMSLDCAVDTLPARQANLADLVASRRVSLVTKTSQDALPALEDVVADMLFIDGDHAYEQVAWEVDNYAPLLLRGGLLCGHDYGVFPGVTRAIDERFKRRFELVGSIWAVRI